MDLQPTRLCEITRDEFKELKLSCEKRIQTTESLQKEVELLKRELNLLKIQTKEERKSEPFVVPCTEGLCVLAKFGNGFYWGRIIKVFHDDTYKILFNDGDEKIKTRKDIIAVMVANFRMISKAQYVLQ